MIKETITYTDFNGNEVTEDLYFNLNKIELMKLSAQDLNFKAVAESGDKSKILRTFEKIVLLAYGVKSEDGKRFIKSGELSREFEQSEAYSEFMFSLITDENKVTNFISGLIPDVEALRPQA